MSRQGMTIDRFRGVIWHLANGNWCRYWLNMFNDDYQTMAFQVRDGSGKPQEIRDATGHGFVCQSEYIYAIKRLNEDGTSYKSEGL